MNERREAWVGKAWNQGIPRPCSVLVHVPWHCAQALQRMLFRLLGAHLIRPFRARQGDKGARRRK